MNQSFQRGNVTISPESVISVGKCYQDGKNKPKIVNITGASKFFLCFFIFIVPTLIHRSNQTKLIFQVPMQEALPLIASASTATFLASSQPIIVIGIAEEFPPETATEAEIYGAEEREGEE
ncbi:hypothetical protein K1719_012633 [Acacia pycnantha]|nr:hypothetical protein K1719_012633 [Acacia pycnantha]